MTIDSSLEAKTINVYANSSPSEREYLWIQPPISVTGLTRGRSENIYSVYVEEHPGVDLSLQHEIAVWEQASADDLLEFLSKLDD